MSAMGSKLLPDELWNEIAELFPSYEPSRKTARPGGHVKT
jgi:hypothetical protein